jgi:hypothetical protein
LDLPAVEVGAVVGESEFPVHRTVGSDSRLVGSGARLV